MGDVHCPKSPTLKHAAEPGNRFDHNTRGTCRHCGATVHRAHRRSPCWWVDWTKDEKRPSTS